MWRVTLGVGLTGDHEGVGGGEVGVGRGHGEDEAGLLHDVGHQHVADLVADVGRLVTDRDFRQTGQIDQGYSQD